MILKIVQAKWLIFLRKQYFQDYTQKYHFYFAWIDTHKVGLKQASFKFIKKLRLQFLPTKDVMLEANNFYKRAGEENGKNCMNKICTINY